MCLDVETTGPDPTHDRVIEIGALFADRGRIEDTWSTLVDPQRAVPVAIQQFTGIDAAMLHGAPAFAQIAPRLHERLAGRLFIAHNARFDLGFLRREFARVGLAFDPPVLCTVRLSRALEPQHPRHGLDALIARHGLDCAARHRALGDARVLWDFLALATRADEASWQAAVARAMRAPQLPPQLDPRLLDDVPEGAGVLIVEGDAARALLVAPGARLRELVLARLTVSSTGRAGRLARQARALRWERSAGVLGAQLRAAALIEALQPRYGRLRRPPASPAAAGLPDWPYAGAVGVAERDPYGEHGCVHVFEGWCHLGSARDWSELDDLLTGVPERRFVPAAASVLHKALQAGRLEAVPLAHRR